MKHKKLHCIALLLFLLCNSAYNGVSAQGKIQQLLNRYYKLVEGDSAKPKKSVLFVLPLWDVTPETGIKLGFSLGYIFRMGPAETTRPSLLRLNSSYTQNRQFNIRPSVDIFFKENTYNLKAQYVYNDFNEYYWGIGSQTLDTAKEAYDFQQHKINLRFTKQVVKNVYAGAQLAYERLNHIHFKEGSPSPSSSVEGINGYNILGAGFCFAYDNRNNIYYPSKGAYLELSNYFYFPSGLSQQKFQNITLDMRKFFPLWKENILAVQGFSSLNFGNVPYRQMGVMGNEMIMRGYYNGRFRDQHFAALQAELRKTIWGPIGMVFFGGFGNVAMQTSNLLQQVKPNYGFGFRFNALRKEHINVRMDFGFGENKIKGFYFTMSDAF